MANPPVKPVFCSEDPIIRRDITEEYQTINYQITTNLSESYSDLLNQEYDRQMVNLLMTRFGKVRIGDFLFGIDVNWKSYL